MSEGIKHEQETWERETIATPDYREYPYGFSSTEALDEENGQDGFEFIAIRFDLDKYDSQEMSAVR
jgi:hypothetical protein